MAAQSNTDAPRLFISYSWTTPDHEAWVLKLAEELAASGVHVILDKWDLREGHDSHAFMEQMVSDPTVTKVAMICDRAYVEKADGRKGGVGTETQIITPQIFDSNQQQQDKYVAVVREHDEQGIPYRPIYFGARIFIDFTEDSDYATSFEQLVRWIYGKPVYARPPLGKKPAFLDDDGAAVKLSIAPSQIRAMEALRNSKAYAVPALRDFLENVVHELEIIKLDLEADPFDEEVVGTVKAFLPYRNAIVDVFIAVANYRNDPDCIFAIHRFFEQLIPLMNYRGNVGSWNEWDFDHFRIIVQELFLYLVAVNLRYDRFEAVAYYTRTPYYVTQANSGGGEPMQIFTILQKNVPSLESRNRRLYEGRRSSPLGDLLKENALGNAVSFDFVMAADFLLYFLVRTMPEARYDFWWPSTLVYMSGYGRGFEVFVRCRSSAFFERFKVVFGVADKVELKKLVAQIDSDPRLLASWFRRPVMAGILMDVEAMGTMP